MATSPTGQRAELNLTAEERPALEKRCHSNKRMEADRARALLKLDQNQNSVQVANELGLHPVAVRRIKQLFVKERLEAVQARKQTGRPPHKRETITHLVENYRQCGKLVHSCGGPLSVAAIRQRLQEEHKVAVSISTVRLVLKKGAIDTGVSGIV